MKGLLKRINNDNVSSQEFRQLNTITTIIRFKEAGEMKK